MAVTLAGAGLVVAGGALLPASTDTGTVPAPSAAGAAAAAPSAWLSAAAAAPAPRGVHPFAPVTVAAPDVGISARVLPVSVTSARLLDVPEDVRQVGWWQDGAAAAAGDGTVVLVGHVDSARQGRGALFPLRRLSPGDRVVVRGAHGEAAAYVVTARRQYRKASLPRAEVFGQGARHRLVLLTCGGRFDARTGHYEDNVVVYATPAGPRGGKVGT